MIKLKAHCEILLGLRKERSGNLSYQLKAISCFLINLLNTGDKKKLLLTSTITSIINLFIHSSFTSNIFQTLKSQTGRARERMFIPHHVSCAMCHVSHITCHLSPVTCHLSYVTCHVSHVTCHMTFSNKKNKK